ncbi:MULTISPECIES: hypothetical protein [unclassified Psychrobacter]|jgi:hypothetical protein|uniref:hypothetical protein n=1 Tax=unclassified Psychrobacter TaxID=196806 RepID=UPI0025EEAB11|nr:MULTISPECIES: hypothetical protein [unclassified Psychrobacter]
MKIFTLKSVTTLTALATLALSVNAFAMDVKFNDAAWNGKKIPEGQQCLNYDGKNPATPSMTVSNIPMGAESLVFVYSDVSNKRMQHGGHGIVEFNLPEGATSAEIPRVFGHTYEVPVGIEMIAEYRSRAGEAGGAYKPPCSGGKNHLYTVDVQAWQGDSVLAETTVKMGRY